MKADLVYATATEDMDSLTYGSNVVLRHLTASEAKLVISSVQISLVAILVLCNADHMW